MIYEPDFKKAYISANEILISSNTLTQFPFKVKNIIKETSEIKCCSYKKAEEYNNLNIESFGSKSAVLIEQNKRKIIFYNETEKKTRIKFSVLHEYGHSRLNHDLDTRNEELYRKYEIETNYFTAQILMPEQLIREIQARGTRITKELLINLFDVSEAAAEKRITTLGKNIKLTEDEKLFDDLIVNKYKNWLDSKVPLNINYNYFPWDDEERQIEREKWKYNY